MPEHAVGIKFTGKDYLSQHFKRMGSNADKFGTRTSSAFRNATKAGYDFQTVVKGIIAANLIRGGVAQVTRGLGTVVEEFVKFDETMIGAAARFSDIGPDATDFADRLVDLKNRAREAAQGTRYTVGQIGETMNTLAKSGLSTQQAFGMLNPVMNLAKATQEDLAYATSVSSDLMGSFGLRTKDAVKNTANMIRMTDVLTKSALSANVGLEDMFEAMKTVGPVAVSYGLGLEQATAMTGFLGNAGIKGTLAATALKNAMVRIPSKLISAELEANGIAVADLSGNMRPLVDIIADMGEKMKNLGGKKQMQIFESVFGLRAIAGAGAMMRGVDGLREFQKLLEDSAGIAQRTGDRIEQSLGSKLMKLGSAALEAGFKVLEAFESGGRKGIDVFTEKVRNFNVTPIIQSIKGLVGAFQLLWIIIQPLTAYLPELVGAFVAIKAVSAALSFGVAAATMFRFFMAAKAAVGVMGLLNMVMTANPIGMIIVGIGALVAGLIWAGRKFQIFSKTWAWIVDMIKQAVAGWKMIFGLTTGSENAPQGLLGGEEAPNYREAMSRQTQFKGRLDITGAPAGSTLTTEGAPTFDMQLLGSH